MKYFLVLLKNKNSALFTQQLLNDHVAFLKNLYQTNTLIICGPFTDNTSAVLIIKTTSIENARRLILQDPFIQSQYYQNFEIHEFQAASAENNWLV